MRNALLLLFFLLAFFACSDETRQKKKKNQTNNTDAGLSQEHYEIDTFNYDDLFLDDSLLMSKSSIKLDSTDSLGNGMYWMGALEIDLGQMGNEIKPSDPDPLHDAFIAIDKEPKMVNIDSCLRLVKLSPEVASIIGPKRVYIKILLSRNGKPKDYFVVKSPDSRLTREVLDKLRFLRAEPAFLDQKPIKCWVNVQYNLG